MVTTYLMKTLLASFAFQIQLLMILFTVVKDILIRCGPSIELCRRQALEANMKLRECFGSFEFFSAHSLAHSLHMCLQDAGRKLEVYS